METKSWHLSLKHHHKPKSVLPFPEYVEPGRYMVATIKQLVSAHLPDSFPDPELIELVHCGCKLKDDLTLDSYGIESGSTLHILKKVLPEPKEEPEPVDRCAATEEFRLLQNVLQDSPSYRDDVFKMLSDKESLEGIIKAFPGLSSDPVGLGVLQNKDLFVLFADPNLLDVLIRSHPALVNAIVLIFKTVSRGRHRQSNNTGDSVYSMPGAFLFEGMSDDDESGSRAGSFQRSRSPTNLNNGGATGPRPITQSELASALALANSPESNAVTPNLGSQDVSAGGSSAATAAAAGVLSRALRQALASRVTPQQGRWQTQMQQLRDMGIRDEGLALRALQATDGDMQTALEIIFARRGGL
ncbi:ubiquitin-like protein 7b [Tachysurus fulvidraco]|uniref:ubiquitin-like protein 7b n=1 Tax=Tachysurus fulvidraco TaxID=1234273 RepID=UPI001FEEC5A5|nr:ubiquitin-like protein 7b [Tachysurus fulvidraco]XP_027035120.2 ubiquitin-like protein 7b [Tachysurus fulvidraco]